MTEMEKDLIGLYNKSKEIREQLLQMYRMTNKILNKRETVMVYEHGVTVKAREAVLVALLQMIEAEVGILDGEMVGHYLRKE